jgi:ABC-type transport system substrate-binding protein
LLTVPAHFLRRSVGWAAVGLTLLALMLVGCTPGQGQGGAVDARLASAEPFTWDPAQAGDAGTASVLAQVFEGLTAFDTDGNAQPALAASWQVSDDGRQIIFQLRPALTYSDGQPIVARDVVDSWLRLIDPARPSPLASLLGDVSGATDYLAGLVGRDGVGLRTDGDSRVVVDLRRPATYFLAVTASPSLAVVPPSQAGTLDQRPATVVSGAYVPAALNAGVIHLTGNPRYWAGLPPLDELDLVTDLGGQNGVDLFSSGELDYVGLGTADQPWVQYDSTLGPQLRNSNGLSINYYGFSTTVAPFDDADVRLAFAEAVDWQHMVTVASGVAASSMIPLGVPGRDEANHQPRFDPEDARALLAAAGYPGGAGLPPITLTTYGVGFEQTVATELEHNLGVHVSVEALDFQDYLQQVGRNSNPQIWTLSWIADYPHAHDFLGLLLETGSTSNTGRWSNSDYDALIEEAAATADPDEQAAIYAQAQEILARQAPVVPVFYDQSYALSRDGLLGALESGVGFIRYAGLDWAPGTGR